MSELLKKLHEQRLNVWNQATELADKAAAENRNFSGEEEATWQRFNEDINGLDKRMKDILDAEARAKETEERFNEVLRRPVEQATDVRTGQNPLNDELRSFLIGEGRKTIQVGEHFRGAFDRYAEGRSLNSETRALSVGTATAGGDLVPIDFYDRLVEHLVLYSAVLRAKPTILNTTAGEEILIPKTTSHPTAGLVAEGGDLGGVGSDPVFGQVAMRAYKVGRLTLLSRELLDDSGVDIEGYLARRVGAAIGDALGNYFVNGTGSNQPQGILTAASVGVTGATGVTGAFTSDNLIDLFHSVIPPYRESPSCAWLLADGTVAAVRKLKDNYGQYLWQPGLQAGQPDTLLSKTAIVEVKMPAVGINNQSIAFGDFSTYYVRFAGGLRFERSDEYAFNTDQVAFRAVIRADGQQVDTSGAVKTFKGAAS